MSTTPRIILSSFFLALFTCLYTLTATAVPVINGKPRIVTPGTLLDWPQDNPRHTPYLSEPTANRLNDFHGIIGACDIVLSTSGNYHMALRELWKTYLSANAQPLGIKTAFYTTSPPISPEQIATGSVQFGNMMANCRPQIAVGPGKIMKKLIAAGVTDGQPVRIIKNHGNVILVKKGNPKHIKTVWDLGKPNVTVVTPNPYMEPGSFGNFSGSIYNIAAQDPNPPTNSNAAALFDRIFNNKTNAGKWVSGKRIMHREIPWAIASGKADAGVIFYHLALYFTRTFPDKFEIVPLGGTALQPEPLPGNRIGVLSAVRIKGNWNDTQRAASDKLMEALRSDAFTGILSKHGIDRP